MVFIIVKLVIEKKMYKQVFISASAFLFAMGVTLSPAMAGGEAEVLHWWTSGGEAKALQVLKDDFAKKGGTWKGHACCRGWRRCRKCYS